MTRLVLLLAFTTACTSAQGPHGAPPPPPAEQPGPVPIGGMWLPEQIPAHGAWLAAHGLRIPAESLADPLEAPLGAVVEIPGCSASFVSAEGLIITNHHCAQGALAYHSADLNRDLVASGYLAADRSEERWNGPTGRVYITDEIVDVTGEMRNGLDRIADPRARYLELETRKKNAVAACERQRPDHRCQVSDFFGGGQYRLIAKLELRDLRLVYAPAGGIGYYGGDTDNWMWPRHTGDYSFMRAYVGKDGKPADYGADNVPYRPKHWLRISAKPVRRGDLILAAGYPGSTQRNQPLTVVRESVEWRYPRTIERTEAVLKVLRELQGRGGHTAIVAGHAIFGFENRLKNNRAMLDQLVRGGLVNDKEKLDRELRDWIAAAPDARRSYADALATIDDAYRTFAPYRELEAMLGELGDVDLLAAASMLVHLAHERELPDAQRKPRYQERNWPRLRGWLASMDKSYDRPLDTALLAMTLERARARADAGLAEHGKWLAHFQGFGPSSTKAPWAPLVERIYDGTTLGSLDRRLELFDGASVASIEASTDPLIVIARALYDLDKDIERAEETLEGALVIAMPLYVEALEALHHGVLAPDANRTLRVTVGRVEGYRPKDDADLYTPFTTLPGVVAKHTGKPPFDAPAALLAAARAPNPAYVDASLGAVPVDFLSEIDLTGGSSGSATLDADGNLIGLAFDTNLEAMGSDWQFQPKRSRAIHVDIRYVLWIMDQVDHAHHLMREMGVTPRTEK